MPILRREDGVLSTSKDMNWIEKERAETFFTGEDGPLTFDDLHKAQAEAFMAQHPELKPVIERLKRHPYIKAIEKACEPPKPSLWQRFLDWWVG